jgi:CheY-like chemotaxis protein/GAF domain-containing protein
MLVIGRTAAAVPTMRELAGGRLDVISSNDVRMPDASADYVVVEGSERQTMFDLQVGAMGLFSALPDGVVLLDDTLQILWHNLTFLSILRSDASLIGQYLQDVMQPADGTDLRTVAVPTTPGEAASLTVKREDRRWLGLRLARTTIVPGTDARQALILTVRDISKQVLEKQKQDAIYRAGLEMGNLTAEEVTAMSHEERTLLLKEQILQLTREVLGYDTFEIRLLQAETQELIPLLEYGMDPEASRRKLFAAESGNGVTGYVAWSRKSYLCADTSRDVLYLCGASASRSSLTVPLMIRDTVLGTFNVESPGTLSFNQKDLDFLTLFGRVVASSLNQLQLLLAEKVVVETENCDRLRREISEPSDEILNAATWILERYIGHDPDVCERLHLITDRIRQISGQIGSVTVPPGMQSVRLNKGIAARPPRPALVGKRILVIDNDPAVREDAHNLLGQMGCEVEAVHDANDGCAMVRNYHYDVVLTDIRLPDANGYECFRRIRAINGHVPIIMMTGFGHDASHSIVKARQEGMKAALYKPFRRAQMLDEVEKAVTASQPT